MMGALEDALARGWIHEELPSDAHIATMFGGAEPPDFAARAEVSASPSENIEDRRGEVDPYAHMLAINQAVRKTTTGLELGFDQLRRPRQSGHLQQDAGYYDIGRNPMAPDPALSQ